MPLPFWEQPNSSTTQRRQILRCYGTQCYWQKTSRLIKVGDGGWSPVWGSAHWWCWPVWREIGVCSPHGPCRRGGHIQTTPQPLKRQQGGGRKNIQFKFATLPRQTSYIFHMQLRARRSILASLPYSFKQSQYAVATVSTKQNNSKPLQHMLQMLWIGGIPFMSSVWLSKRSSERTIHRTSMLESTNELLIWFKNIWNW